MGMGEAVDDRKKVEQAAERLAMIAGQKADGHHRASRSRPSSCARARRSAARSRCARRGCTSSSTGDQYRAAARSRFPRPRSEELRWPRQLLARIKEDIDLAGDRLRQGAGHLGMDITVCTTAQDRRRGAGAADRFQFPVPAVRAVERHLERGWPGDTRWRRRVRSRRTIGGRRMAKKYAGSRARLKALAQDKARPMEEASQRP